MGDLSWRNLDWRGRAVYVLVVICFVYGAFDLVPRVTDRNSECVNSDGVPRPCTDDNAIPRVTYEAKQAAPPPASVTTSDPDESVCVGPADGEPRDCADPGAVSRAVYEDSGPQG